MWNSDQKEHKEMIPVGGQYNFPMYASLIKHDDSWYMTEAEYLHNISVERDND